MTSGVRRFWAAEGGQGLVEYALLLALAVATALAGLKAVAGTIAEQYAGIEEKFT